MRKTAILFEQQSLRAVASTLSTTHAPTMEGGMGSRHARYNSRSRLCTARLELRPPHAKPPCDRRRGAASNMHRHTRRDNGSTNKRHAAKEQ